MTNVAFKTDNELDTLLDESISVWFQRDIEPFEVKIFAEKSAAKFFRRRPLPTQKIESINTDGSMEFSVKITHEMEILPLIKYWIPHIYVIEPEWIKEIIQEDLEVYSKKIAQIK